jgi:trypsin
MFAMSAAASRAAVGAALAAALLGCAVSPAEDLEGQAQQELIGGFEATPGEFPWQVQLSIPGSPHWCSGSVIERQWILTAAHCAAGLSAGDFTVRAGLHRRSAPDGNVQTRRVAQILVHPAYNAALHDNDVALLQLATPVTFTPRIQPVPIRTSGELVVGPGIASGWGQTSSSGAGAPADALRKAVLPLVTADACNAAGTLPFEVRPSMLCAGDAVGQRAICHGDEGGSLVVPLVGGGSELIGVASWGAASCNTFSVFTHALKFNNFVRAAIGAAPIPGDVNNSGCVDADDNAAVTAAFGQTVPPADPALDLTQDGIINIFDRLIVLQNIGAGCS